MELDIQRADVIAQAVFRDVHKYAQEHQAEYQAFLRDWPEGQKGGQRDGEPRSRHE